MASTQQVHTLGQVVADGEAALFVGRAPELAAFREALADARTRPVALYVHGPAGVGKSALLRACWRAAQEGGVPGALIDMQELGRAPDELLRGLIRQLGPQSTADILCSAADLVTAVNRRARAAGLTLLLDSYDAMAAGDDWLRREVFRHFGTGVCLVLAGRMIPAQIWAHDLGWRRALREIALTDLSPDEVAEFLQRCGIHNPAVGSAVVALSGGSPLLLQRAANTLLRRGPGTMAEWTSGPWTAESEHALASFLIELMLHPSSRRRTWRAGAGSAPLDSLIAASSLLPDFDREVLTAMVGRPTVEGAWSTMLELPVITLTGRIYRFHGPFRHRLETAVLRQRPWAERHWRRLAIAHHLRRAQEGPTGDEQGLHWARVAHLAREAGWYAWTHPEGEDREAWRFEQGLRAGGREALPCCLAVAPGGEAGLERPAAGAARGGTQAAAGAAPVSLAGAAGWAPAGDDGGVSAAAHLARHFPEHLLVARGATGQLLGWLAAVPLEADTRSQLCALPGAAGAYLRALSPSVLDAWQGRTLLWCGLGAADPTSGVEGALVREACRALQRFDRVVVPEATAAHGAAPLPSDGRAGPHPLARLGFERDPGAADVPGGEAPAPAWRLDLATAGYAAWLKRLVTADVAAPLPPGERATAAKEALQVLDDPERLARTDVARHYAALTGDPTPGAVRAWLLDALASADLGDGPAAGRILLSLYYVERAGSHEAVAERMDLPRATYFRCHRQALARLGDVLCG